MNLIQKINLWGYKKKDSRPNLPETESIGKSPFWIIKALRLEKSRSEGDRRWYGWVLYAYYTLISAIIYFPILLALKTNQEFETYQPYAIGMAISFVVYIFMYGWSWYKGEIQLNSRGSYYHHRDAHARDLLVMAQIPLLMLAIYGVFN